MIASIKSVKEAELILCDLCTPQELETMTERIHLIRELVKGTPQREISKKLGISISKITRGSRALQEGGEGFRLILKPKKRK